MALALLLHGQKSLFGFENGHIKQKAVHKVHVNSAKIWGIKMEIYLTAEVPMGINIDQLRVQRNRYQMTPSIEALLHNQPEMLSLKTLVEFQLTTHTVQL